MSRAQQFDSGGVIRRARAVLTFSTGIRGAVLSRGPGAHTPTPHPMSLHSAPPPQRSLPVIPHIARRKPMGGALVRPMAHGGLGLWRAGLEPMLFAVLGLITLGSIAVLGMRSLSDERGMAATMPAAATTATAEARVLAERASEDTLARAPQPSRVESPPVLEWTADAPPPHVGLALRGRLHPGLGASHRAGARSHAHVPPRATRKRTPAVIRTAPVGAAIPR
jgi:hypothetical protein